MSSWVSFLFLRPFAVCSGGIGLRCGAVSLGLPKRAGTLYSIFHNVIYRYIGQLVSPIRICKYMKLDGFIGRTGAGTVAERIGVGSILAVLAERTDVGGHAGQHERDVASTPRYPLLSSFTILHHRSSSVQRKAANGR
jgi:hypothetical protein